MTTKQTAYQGNNLSQAVSVPAEQVRAVNLVHAAFLRQLPPPVADFTAAGASLEAARPTNCCAKVRPSAKRRRKGAGGAESSRAAAGDLEWSPEVTLADDSARQAVKTPHNVFEVRVCTPIERVYFRCNCMCTLYMLDYDV
jgi:hypothetical protein